MAKKNKIQTVNFEETKKAAVLFDKGIDFYRDILKEYDSILSSADKFKIEAIINAIKTVGTTIPSNLNEKTVNDFQIIKDKLINSDPEKFDKFLVKHQGEKFTRNLDWIIKKCNEANNKNLDYYNYFKTFADIATTKKIKYSSNFKEISDNLIKTKPPTMKQVFYLNDYLESNSN